MSDHTQRDKYETAPDNSDLVSRKSTESVQEVGKYKKDTYTVDEGIEHFGFGL